MPGVTKENLLADYEECNTAAKEADPNIANPYIDYTQSTASVAGASFASGFMKGMEKAKFRRQVQESCMNKKGYAKTWLTEVELEEFKAAKKDGKEDMKTYLHKIASQERNDDRMIDPDAK